MMVFWLIAGGAMMLAALLILGGARRGARPLEAARGVDRGQLDELDALKARGLITDDAWRIARAEAGRRLLADAREPAQPRPPSALDARMALGGVIATGLGVVAIYMATGSPGLADQPFERRVDAWAATHESLDPQPLAAVAERVAAEQPRDPRAQVFLGRARLEAGDPIGAASAFRRALEVQPADASVWARLGEALTEAGQGTVGADAEAAFRRALDLDASQPVARLYLGEAALQRGDVTAAAGFWEPLLTGLPADDPRTIAMRQRLEAVR